MDFHFIVTQTLKAQKLISEEIDSSLQHSNFNQYQKVPQYVQHDERIVVVL
jgi:hypothetical protein